MNGGVVRGVSIFDEDDDDGGSVVSVKSATMEQQAILERSWPTMEDRKWTAAGISARMQRRGDVKGQILK